MRRVEVEIYADSGNDVILRHPGRHFPGCLIPGDSLRIMLQSLKAVARESSALSGEAASELDDVICALSDRLARYKTVLHAHHIDLPFVEGSDG